MPWSTVYYLRSNDPRWATTESKLHWELLLSLWKSSCLWHLTLICWRCHSPLAAPSPTEGITIISASQRTERWQWLVGLASGKGCHPESKIMVKKFKEFKTLCTRRVLLTSGYRNTPNWCRHEKTQLTLLLSRNRNSAYVHSSTD